MGPLVYLHGGKLLPPPHLSEEPPNQSGHPSHSPNDRSQIEQLSRSVRRGCQTAGLGMTLDWRYPNLTGCRYLGRAGWGHRPTRATVCVSVSDLFFIRW
jgi:hypothetical protein